MTAPLFGVPIYTVPVERAPIPVGDARSPGFSSSSRHDGSRAAWPTGDPLDLSINGPGYFRVASHDGAAFGEVLYTRSGDFGRDADGYVVDGSGRYLIGYALGADGKPTDTETRIQVPSEAVSVSVGADGIVVATDASAVPRSIGAISLAGFPKPPRRWPVPAEGPFARRPPPAQLSPARPAQTAWARSPPRGSSRVGLDRLLADTFSGRHGVAGSHRLAQAVTEAYSGLAQLGRRRVLA